MDAVRRISWSGLFAAFSLTMLFYYALGLLEFPCSQLPSSLRCDQLTDAGIGRLGCRALLVAAALLALTIAGHCFYATARDISSFLDPVLEREE